MMERDNLALCMGKQGNAIGNSEWSLVYISDLPTDIVPKETWDLVVSGYQPLDKWLKDRSNKALTGDEIRHFQKIVVALSRSSKLMEEIDQEIEFTRALYQDAT